MVNGKFTKVDISTSFNIDKPTFRTSYWDSTTGNQGVEYILENGKFRIIQNDCDWAMGTIVNDIWYQLYEKVKFLFFFNRWKEINSHLIDDDDFEELFNIIKE